MPEFGPFRMGDVPAASLEWEVITDDDFNFYTSAVAILVAPDGTVTAEPDVTFEEAEGGYVFSIGQLGDDPFPQRGIYRLQVTLEGTDTQLTLEPLTTVAQDDSSGWHTLDSARDEWRDAPAEDAILWTLLDAAHTACIEYAPVIEEDDVIPSNYRQAQLYQARALWTFAKTNAEGSFGAEGFQVVNFVHPLDLNIRQLLRPKKGVPSLW